VTVILDSLAEGASKDEILGSYPSLRAVHIDAALAYAAELAHDVFMRERLETVLNMVLGGRLTSSVPLEFDFARLHLQEGVHYRVWNAIPPWDAPQGYQ
jgi:hypothetical protein